MLLSIVMMVKNEEKNLKRTLSSLAPLMESIESELVILDTGSNDKTVEIAKKFTDKVYYSEWNKNFSDMRNKSISYAKGQWILILDADEVLTEYKEIVDFFKNSKFKKYNSALVIIKNLLSKDNLEKYNELKLVRLFKNDKQFKYTGCVHEQPIYKKPVYESVLAEFYHYGYLYEDEELKQYKVSRNEELLLEEISKKPNDPYLNYQIGKNYIIANDSDKACKHLKIAIELYKKNKIIPSYVYQNLAKVYLIKIDYISCEKLCYEYFENISDCDIDIFYFLGKAQFNMSKLEECKKNYDKYLYLLENYNKSHQSKSFYCESSTLTYKEDVIIDIICACNIINKYEDIVYYYDKYLKETTRNNEVIFILINALYKTNKLEKLKNYYQHICKTQSDKNKFIMTIEKYISTVSAESRKEIIEELVNFDDNYKILNQIRQEKEVDINIYKHILTKENQCYYGDIIYYAIQKSYDIMYILEDVDTCYLQDFLKYIVINRVDIVSNIYQYLIDAENTLDISKIKVYMCIANALLTSSKLAECESKKIFDLYKTYSYLFIKTIYNSILKDEELCKFIVDLDFKFIINFSLVSRLKELEDIEYIRNIKKLVIEYPKFSKHMNLIIEDYKKEKDENSELRSLKEKYKSIIKNSISTGATDEAISMIDEYENIFSNDIDILNMKAIVEMINGNYKSADRLLKEAYIVKNDNYETIYNIAYTKECLGDIEEAIRFYKFIIINCEDDILISDVTNQMNAINHRQIKIKGRA